MKQSKRIYIEILRILACFFVIFNHTGNDGFLLFASCPAGGIKYWLYMFVSVFCKFSVPMFFLLSGALLIPKEESLRDILRKRVLRIVIVLIAFSFISYLVNIRKDFSQFSIKGFLIPLYQSNHNYSYWYLYAFIPYLLSLPFLRAMAKHMENRHFLYLAVLGLIFMAVIPLAEYLLWDGKHALNSRINFDWLLSSAVIYPCLGYYLENRMDVSKAQKHLGLLWVINILTIIVTCVVKYVRQTRTGSGDETFLSAFSVVNVITLFITFKCLFSGIRSQKAGNVFALIGGATFGIYLLHISLMSLFGDLRVLDFLRGTLNINYMLSAFIYCLVIFTAGGLITLLLKLIPGVKKLL